MKRACLNISNGHENLKQVFLSRAFRGSSDLIKLKYLPMNKILVIFLCLQFSFGFIYAQQPYKQIKSANKLLEENKFKEAEIMFRRALESDNPWVKQAMFNLGNSLYKQENFQEAERFYSDLLNNKSLNKNELSQVWHNKGNSQLQQKKFKESIDSYKNALRLNPNDNDTRYNMSYALRMLQQQQQQQQENQDKQDNQDGQDGQDNQDNQQDNDKKDQNQDDNNKSNDKNEQDKKEQEGKQSDPRQMSKEDINKMLNALSNKDRNTLQELREKEKPASSRKTDKDW